MCKETGLGKKWKLPAVNFIKALMPAIFYWGDTAKKYILAFKTQFFGQSGVSYSIQINCSIGVTKWANILTIFKVWFLKAH